MTAIVKDGQLEGVRAVGPDLSKPGWLGEIARTDPQLAYALGAGVIIPGAIGWNEPRCGSFGWQALNVTARFEAGTANQTIRGRINGIVEADLWVRAVTYTVRRPNAFAGSIFKAQSDYFNSLNPNVDFSLIIKGYCKYLIAPDPMPLENIKQVFNDCCPMGLVFGCSSQVEMTVLNTRALAADEIPTEVILTLHGIRLPAKYDCCTVDVALRALKDAGVL